MNYIALLLLFILTSCVGPLDKGEISLNLSPEVVKKHKESNLGLPSISTVSLDNDQLTVSGLNFTNLSSVKINSQNLSVVSNDGSTLILSAPSAVMLALNTALNLVVETAAGAASVSVTFNLVDGSVTASKIGDGEVGANHLSSMGAGVGQVMQWNGTTWVPTDLSGLTYLGSWDATTSGVGPDAGGGSSAGEYYVVSNPGTVDVDGISSWAAGDWVVWNGTSWDKIDNSTGVTSFNGRTGTVTPQANDYTWAQIDKTTSSIGDLSDVDMTGVAANKILKWDGSKWAISDDLSSGGAGSVSSAEIQDGTIQASDLNAGLNTTLTQVGTNTTDIATNASDIATNAGNITTANSNIATNASNISTNTSNITSNASSISTNTTNIASNTTAIGNKVDKTTTVNGQALSSNVTLTTSNVGEGTNLYYTAARAKADAILNSTAGSETDQAASVAAMKSYVLAQTGAITGSQWTTSGSDIYYNAGNVGIGTNSPTTSKVVIQQSVDSNVGGLRIQNSDNSGALRIWKTATGTEASVFTEQAVDTMALKAGKVGIGTLTPSQALEVQGTVSSGSRDNSISGGGYHVNHHGNNAWFSGVYGYKSRAGATVQDNDQVGQFIGSGYDGTSYKDAASIIFRVDGTPSTGIVPGEMSFYTANSAGTLQNRMTINSAGNVGIGTASPLNKLDVAGYTQIERGESDDSNYWGLGILRKRSDGISPNAGFGASFGFILEGSTDNSFVSAGQISNFWEQNQTDDTGQRDSALSFSTMLNNTMSEKMRISSNGYLGLGTASPQQKLDLYDGIMQVTRTEDDSTSRGHILLVRGDGSGAKATINTENSGSNDVSGISFHINSAEKFRINSNGSVNATSYYGDGSNLTGISASSSSNTGDVTIAADSDANTSGTINFTTAGTTKMTISNSGNIGIGTTSPLDALHVKSAADDSRMILDSASSFDSELKFMENGVTQYTIGHDAATNNFVIGTSNVDTGQRLVIDSSGNVGIGTSAPSNALHVVKNVNSEYAAFIKNGGGSGQGLLIEANAGSSEPLLNARNNLGTSSLYVQGDGKVGIGTTAPIGKFHVDGSSTTARITSSSGPSYLLMGNRDSLGANNPSAITAANGSLYFGGGDDWTSATGGTLNYGMNLSDAGNLFIGTGTTTATEKLQVKGNLYLDSSSSEIKWNGNNLDLRLTNDAIPVVSVRGTASYDSRFDMYDAGDDEVKVQLKTGGSSYFNGGNVGVGTSTPTEKLEVSGNIKADGLVLNGPIRRSSGYTNYISNLPWYSIGSGNVEGYVKLVTPIVHDEVNMFSIKIRGYTYGNVNYRVMDIHCGGYAYSGGGLVSHECKADGTDLPVEIASENRSGTNLVVIRIGTPTTPASRWYYGHFTAEYVGWVDKDPSGFSWVLGETTPALGTNFNNVILNDYLGTITTTGKIGVGNSSPTATVDIFPTTGQVAGLKIDARPNSTGPALQIAASTRSSVENILEIEDSSGANNLVLKAGGDMGLGISSPISKLDVSGGPDMTAGYNRTLTLHGNHPSLVLKSNGNRGGILYDGAAPTEGMGFYVKATTDDVSGSGTRAMTIFNDGNVGIGTAVPSSKLDIQSSNLNTGVLRILESAGGNSIISLSEGGSGNGKLYVNKVDGSNSVVLASAGDSFFMGGYIGIGTTSPSEKLHVVGNLRVQGSTDCTLGGGAGATNCTSDRRLKDNIVHIPYALDKIRNINGVEFDWNEDSLSPGKHSIGVIAQEIQKVFPTAVIENADGYLSVDYAVLVSPLIEATKELDRNLEMYKMMNQGLAEKVDKNTREIASLKEENEDLKKKVESLEERLERLERLLEK
ncbi:tail fiber domain-containing protein [Bacteriovorax sp. Seq25_V]|uniref:tail fiber domain-containing protein n=1 Tax=Bacteriovorax sp. Seq25_V TaxID=1201288 RepID=UPI00038A15C5|nr:tail fiber domain-containing protein [Bacteriovorax sp. Seq25_V]EQC45504.1 endosialidase chaperone [Bacteriovorax sp. Seq25_V]